MIYCNETGQNRLFFLWLFTRRGAIIRVPVFYPSVRDISAVDDHVDIHCDTNAQRNEKIFFGTVHTYSARLAPYTSPGAREHFNLNTYIFLRTGKIKIKNAEAHVDAIAFG